MIDQIPTSEVLYLAADLIEQQGWTQVNGTNSIEDDIQAWYPKPGSTLPLCLEGGLYSAAGSCSDSYDAKVALGEYLGIQWTRLYVWNDRTAKSAAEVIEVLRACAVIEAAKENADVRESVMV